MLTSHRPAFLIIPILASMVLNHVQLIEQYKDVCKRLTGEIGDDVYALGWFEHSVMRSLCHAMTRQDKEEASKVKILLCDVIQKQKEILSGQEPAR